MKRFVGTFLLAAPFVAVIGGSVATLGWVATAAVLGLVAAIVACIWVGAELRK